MELTFQTTPPETLLETISIEALSVLALGGEKGIPDIVPLEAALPLIAKAWSLPETLLKKNTDLLEQGKAQAARGEAVLPENTALEYYDGWTITASCGACSKRRPGWMGARNGRPYTTRPRCLRRPWTMRAFSVKAEKVPFGF